jgi:hypothetical protein
MPHQGNVQEATTGVSGQGAGNARCYALRLKAQCVTNSARRANHFPIYGKHVKPLTQKYSAFQNTQISGIAHPSHPAKGRIAIVTRRAVGCDGRCGVRQLCCRTKRPQRTAKSCGPGAAIVASIHAGLCWHGNGDKKRRSPGRVRISRQTIARGRPGCLGCTCLIRVRPFYHLHTVLRAQSAPGFPCALCLEEGRRDCRTRAKTCRGNAEACHRHSGAMRSFEPGISRFRVHASRAPE